MMLITSDIKLWDIKYKKWYNPFKHYISGKLKVCTIFAFKEFNQYPDGYLDHYLKWSGRFFFEFVTDMHAFIPQTGIMLSAVPRK